MPAARQYKATVIWDWPAAGTGWTETWYSGPTTTYLQVQTVMETFIGQKLNLQIDQTYARALKISDIGVAGDVYPIFYGNEKQGKVNSAGCDNLPAPWEAVLFEKLTQDFFYHGFAYWHGLCDFSAKTSPRVYDPGRANLTLLQAAITTLVNAGFGWRAKDKDPLPPTPFKIVPLAFFQGVRITEHRVGRPFGLPVGRRRIA